MGPVPRRPLVRVLLVLGTLSLLLAAWARHGGSSTERPAIIPVRTPVQTGIIATASPSVRHKRHRAPGAGLPPQGLYDSCAPGTTAAELAACEGRLTAMATAGFAVVLNYDVLYASAANLAAYAQFAAAHGLRIMWALHEQGWWDGAAADRLSDYADLAATCGCTTNAGLLAYVVGLLQGSPATWGYYIADEPDASRHAAVRAYNQRVKALDPAHPTLLVSAEDCSTLGTAIKPFADAADVLAADYYPIGTNCPISAWATIAHAVQAAAAGAGKAGTVMIPQTFAWAEYPGETWVCSPFPGCASAYPTAAQMQQERDLILHNSAPLVVLWYSYFVNGSNAAVDGQHWADIQTAAFAPLDESGGKAVIPPTDTPPALPVASNTPAPPTTTPPAAPTVTNTPAPPTVTSIPATATSTPARLTATTVPALPSATPPIPPAATSTTVPTTTVSRSPAKVVVTQALALSALTVAAGQTVTGSFTVQNKGGASITLSVAVVASRPPGGGMNADFSSVGPITLASGQSYTVVEHRTVKSTDPVGAGWYALASYQTRDGRWHEQSPVVRYTVTAASQ